MLVDDILDSRYHLYTDPSTGANSVSGCYSGDLLSVVMKSAKAQNLLVTVIANINTIAVAVLIDLPAIIFCEGNRPSAEMIRKADEEKIALISTPQNAVEVILDLSRRGLV
jgi:hexokinase